MDKSVVGMSLFRILPNGKGRSYSAVRFCRGYLGACRTLRQFQAVGWIGAGDYGVLDLLDAQGDIVVDYPIPTSQAFQRIKQKLRLVVEGSE